MRTLPTFGFRHLSLSLVLATTAARAAVIDPNAPPDTLLDGLSAMLDDAGVDVQRSLAPPIGALDRPRLARLDGFASVAEVHEPLAQAQTLGFAARLLAGADAPPHRSTEGTAPDLTWAEWTDPTNPSPRVFLSFAQADRTYASKIRAGFEAQGYRVKTYLREGQETPEHTIEGTGSFFGTADHHLVLITDASRNSRGVFAEALLCGGAIRCNPALPTSAERTEAPVVALKPGPDSDIAAISSLTEHIVAGCTAGGAGSATEACVRDAWAVVFDTWPSLDSASELTIAHYSVAWSAALRTARVRPARAVTRDDAGDGAPLAETHGDEIDASRQPDNPRRASLPNPPLRANVPPQYRAAPLVQSQAAANTGVRIADPMPVWQNPWAAQEAWARGYASFPATAVRPLVGQ